MAHVHNKTMSSNIVNNNNKREITTWRPQTNKYIYVRTQIHAYKYYRQPYPYTDNQSDRSQRRSPRGRRWRTSVGAIRCSTRPVRCPSSWRRCRGIPDWRRWWKRRPPAAASARGDAPLPLPAPWSAPVPRRGSPALRSHEPGSVPDLWIIVIESLFLIGLFSFRANNSLIDSPPCNFVTIIDWSIHTKKLGWLKESKSNEKLWQFPIAPLLLRLVWTQQWSLWRSSRVNDRSLGKCSQIYSKTYFKIQKLWIFFELITLKR